MKEIGNADCCPYCKSPQVTNVPVHRLLPGGFLKNRYFVGENIGEGGFGLTYIGYDKIFQRKIAIKEYFPYGFVGRNNTVSSVVQINNSEEKRLFVEKGLRRFLDEARILGKFQNNPGIVSVYDFFEENNTAYIVMEYLHGETLKTYIEKNGCIPAKNLIPLMIPLMKTLNEVHKNNLIHRDISPDNIMFVEGEANIKLLDFGAARDYSMADGVSMSVVLKRGFAPEEQYRSKGKQGPWTDVYALCATMYMCITGIRPEEAIDRIAADEMKSPSELGVSINPQTEKVIMKGLSVYAEGRYSSIDEMLGALKFSETQASFNNDNKKTVYEESKREEKTVAAGSDVEADINTAVTPKKNIKYYFSQLWGIIAGPLIKLVLVMTIFSLIGYGMNFKRSLDDKARERVDVELKLSKTEEIKELDNGYKLVKKDEYWGMVNTENVIILPIKYKNITIEEGTEFFRMESEDKEFGYCDAYGEIIVPVAYDLAGCYEDSGVFWGRHKKYQVFHYFNTESQIIPPKNYSIFQWDPDAKLFLIQKGEKFGYCDKYGEIIVPARTWVGWDKEAQLIKVQDLDMFGYYNTNGDVIVPVRYSECGYHGWDKFVGEECLWASPFDGGVDMYNYKGEMV